MDTVIIPLAAAIAAGARARLKDDAGQAGRDAYAAVKSFLVRNYPGIDLTAIEAEPESAARQAVLSEELTEVGADRDAELQRLVIVLIAALTKRKEPLLQPFVSQVLRQLSTADPSVSVGQIIIDALRSIPLHQLKSIAKSASSEQVRSLLGSVPADHLKELIASIPVEVLQPEDVPVVEESPPNLAPATILQTTYENMPLPIPPTFDHTTQQVTAYARHREHIDLFVIGFDNVVWSTLWQPDGRGWRPWFQIHPETVFDHTTQRVTAAAPTTKQINLFVIGFDNVVWSTYWTARGDWRPWFPINSPLDWAKDVCGGSTIGLSTPPKWEWMPVYDSRFEREGSLENPVAGLTGWVSMESLDSTRSKKDVPFVHPFGFDWQLYVVPDQRYESLLAPSNTGQSSAGIDSEYDGATRHAREVLGLRAPAGVLGLETDQDLVPIDFRREVTDGSRIAVFGRLITDCGHNDFHTEIHAPLLMAVARPAALGGDRGTTEVTSVRIMSRPYTVSQQFHEGNFVAHLVTEVAKVEASILGIPLSWRVEAHPHVFTRPYDGLTLIKLLVKPPSLRRTALDRLTVSFHFTHRRGVAVQVFNAGDDTAGIIIVLGALNPAPLPTKRDWNISVGDLITLDPDNGGLYEDIIFVDALIDPVGAVILALGILTDRYDPPNASSPLDSSNVALGVPLEGLNATMGVSEDDAQPFPIYGWLNLAWQRSGVVEPAPQTPPAV